ncbi:uncharacterized protein LOC110446766 [Mizuhopecten yessoensis]|uniref:Cyclin-dependent kinase inhibitor 1 n=1 Tax=Mizuhopecten yessoensis TaxID=6573 RepID=A0A210QWM5_MIZYE|nr:uncharacterized protein LOC110446766 [Mizuhopecten yessoensis]OWF53150.1 Cyclin-dependent kinase inhibitor 1 [Mizuhopecten yessoensis]
MIASKMLAVVQLKENINITNNKTMDVSRVRRCLFGKPEKDSLKAEVSNLYARDCAEAKSRWNYDIVNDVPEDGPLVWEPASDCPEFYKRGYTSKFRRVLPRLPCARFPCRGYSDDSDDECIQGLSTHSATSDEDSVLSSQEKCNNSEDCKNNSTPNPEKLKQTHMDAFLRKRKRAVTQSASSTTSSKTRRLE